MKKIKQRCEQLFSNAKLVNLLIAFLGIIVIYVATRFDNTMFTILISIGTSILATAIVTYLNSKYLIKQSVINEMIQAYGLDGIYRTRAEANFETNELLKKAKSLEICAMGLKNFREAQGSFIAQKVSEGMKIKIITIDPRSRGLSEIDENESNTHGATQRSIEELIEWVSELKETAILEGQVEIRTYDRYPYDFYFCIDGDVFTGPYHDKSSQQTITYKYLASTLGAKVFTDNFNKQWEKAKHVQ